jgi:glycosyltransferase involved in cell wall biosynthesis
MISIVIPYYMNPGMLAHQYSVWASYSEPVKRKVEVVLVDDGSPTETALEVNRPTGLPPLRIFQVLEDRPWHQHGARNLGAHMAENDWLLMTDMDHVVPEDVLAELLKRAKRGYAYMFPRVDWPDMITTVDQYGQPKPHPNSFALSHATYWRVGGYDEDYCGIYGTDALFRERLKSKVQITLTSKPLIRFSRLVLPDASTRTLPRKEGREPHQKDLVKQKKKDEGRENEIRTLDFEWVQVH